MTVNLPIRRPARSNVPIYASSTYAQEEIGKHQGYEYSRVSNPTRTALEENLASLEGGASAHVFSSGMAAIAALVAMFKTGDHVLCGSNVYGGTPRLFDRIIANYGIQVHLCRYHRPGPGAAGDSAQYQAGPH